MNAPTHRWDYQHANGSVAGYVLRFDSPAGKVIVPHFIPDGHGGFTKGALPTNRPLYGLLGALYVSDKLIFITEGEKCAKALHGLGFAAVCSLGGSNAPHLTDWTPITPHKGPIYLLADNDLPGEQYAEAVAALVNNINLKVVRLPNLPPKGDVVDWLQRLHAAWDGYELLSGILSPDELGATRAMLLEACNAAAVALSLAGDSVRVAIEEPLPLVSVSAEAQPFPIDALGAYLGPAAVAIHDVVKAPMAICAQSVLAAATLAVQGHADVVLPNGQRRPVSNFFLSLADSGERKTSCDNEALKAIRAHEKELECQRQNQLTVFENQRDVYEQGRKLALGEKNPTKRQEEVYRLGERPQPPLESLLTCPEPTFEGLCRLLADGQPSMGIFSSEGGQFFGGHGMNDDNRLRNITGYSNLWDGQSIRAVRKGDGTNVLDGRRLSIHLMMQPDVAQPFLADELLQQQGFLSRFLLCAPPSTMGTRFYRDPSADSVMALELYHQHILGILQTKPLLAEGQRNELQPRGLVLSPVAKDVWRAFHDECEAKLANTGEYADIRGFANKLPEHALRLAGALTLVGDIQAQAVALEAMQDGITLARYYAGEALRLAESRLTDTATCYAEKVRLWLLACWEHEAISIPDLQNRGPRCVRNLQYCNKTVAILAQHGWLIPLEGGAVINGKSRKTAWQIVNPQSPIAQNRQGGE